jgi:DNA recombination protein RmuC
MGTIENVIVAALAGILLFSAWRLLARHGRLEELVRATQDALERARTSLSSETHNAVTSLQSVIVGNVNDLGHRVNHQLNDSRREHADALSGIQQFLTNAHGSQATEWSKALLQLQDRLTEAQRAETDALHSVAESMGLALAEARREQNTALESNTNALVGALEGHGKSLADTRGTLQKELGLIREAQAIAAAELGKQVALELERLRKDNEEKLEKIRATVDDKLHTTLENRLGESFKQVSDRLEQLHRGLGEMQALAEGVGDLRRVLSNVRNRGTFGEVQLGALLEDVLTPDQYSRNVSTRPGSSERVEYAVHLPGREDRAHPVLLPIDAKFPIADYERLQAAYEAGDASAIQEHRKALRVRTLQEASAISSKYLAPPATTDFALMFLPSESLFAEVLRIPGLMEDLRDARVIAVGPMTLQAILNSLQMGFKTLAIEKRSAEVWRLLSAIKAEFGKFGDSLGAVSKKLQEAQNKIDEATKRSRAVERKLHTVHELPAAEAAALLGTSASEEDLPAEEASSVSRVVALVP